MVNGVKKKVVRKINRIVVRHIKLYCGVQNDPEWLRHMENTPQFTESISEMISMNDITEVTGNQKDSGLETRYLAPAAKVEWFQKKMDMLTHTQNEMCCLLVTFYELIEKL
jgi:5'(3')-deoxyribonucleotidase